MKALRVACTVSLSCPPGGAAGEGQGQQPGSAAPRWRAGCTPCVGAAVRRRSLSSCSLAGETLACLSGSPRELSTGVLRVRRVLQALQGVEGLLAGMPQAQLALMEASLPLREGGCVPALQVRHAPPAWCRSPTFTSPRSLCGAHVCSGARGCACRRCCDQLCRLAMLERVQRQRRCCRPSAEATARDRAC